MMKIHNEAAREWWINYATEEVDGMLVKMAEYGAGDLYVIGETFAKLAGLGVTAQEHYEIGVLFYVVGKVQRLLSAVENGNQASDDTWHDLAVYAKMVLATRNGVL
jgi:hypothetical protein